MLVDLIDTNSHQFLLSGVSDLDVFSTMTAQPGGIVMDEDACSEDSEDRIYQKAGRPLYRPSIPSSLPPLKLDQNRKQSEII